MHSENKSTNDSNRSSESSLKPGRSSASRAKLGSSNREYTIESEETLPGSGYWTTKSLRCRRRPNDDAEDDSQRVVRERDDGGDVRGSGDQRDELRLDDDFDRLCNYFSARGREDESKERRRRRRRPSSRRSANNQSNSESRRQNDGGGTFDDSDDGILNAGHYTSASMRQLLHNYQQPHSDPEDETIRERRRRRPVAATGEDQSTIRERAEELDREFERMCAVYRTASSGSPHRQKSSSSLTSKKAPEAVSQRARSHPRWRCPQDRLDAVNPLRSDGARTTILLIAALLVLLCNWQRLGQYAEDFVRGFYFVAHTVLTSSTLWLQSVGDCARAANGWLETIKCDLADATCERFDRLCDERCSHLDRFTRARRY